MSGDTPSTDTAHPRRRRDPEFWIAIGALVVSAMAMFTSFQQVGLQRSQERAMVWPHVSARPSYSDAGYAFVATNKGLGPALVHRVELRVGGKAVRDVPGVLDAVLGRGHGYGWDKVRANDLEDTILSPGQSVELLGVPWDARTRTAFGSQGLLSARICYCSFLSECWWSRDGLDHERIDQCPAPPG